MPGAYFVLVCACVRVCAFVCTWASRGIIPRAVFELFNVLKEAAAEGTSAIVSCSYLQIYNDKLFDLLADRCCRLQPTPVWTSRPAGCTCMTAPFLLRLVVCGARAACGIVVCAAPDHCRAVRPSCRCVVHRAWCGAACRKNKRPLALREQERSHKREVFVAGLSEYRCGLVPLHRRHRSLTHQT